MKKAGHSHGITLLAAALSLLLVGGRAHADDAHNRCASPNPHVGAAVSIPADDSVHLDANGIPTLTYEDWYWNAVLVGDDGHTYGVETIVFQFYFGFILDVTQIALTDVATGEYQNQLIWDTSGVGYPYVPNGYSFAISDSDGSFSGTGGSGRDSLSFKYSDGTVVNLKFEGLKNPAPALDNGIGHMVDPITGTNHGTQKYYSRRQMAVVGTIARPGKQKHWLGGDGWMEREYGTVIGTPGTPSNNVHWQWLSVHLSDDTDYMMWDMQANDTGNTVMHWLNEIGSAPACKETTFSSFTMTKATQTTHTDGPPPSYLNLGGHLSVPAEKLELDVVPLTNNQIITTGGLFAPFFEGAATFSGTKNGHRVVGTGYYEQFASDAGGCCQSP